MPAEPAPGRAHPIDAPGTSERDWAAWRGLAAVPILELADCPSAVIAAAHPDDKVLGAGGIIAMLAARGARLRIVAVTDGEEHRIAERLASITDAVRYLSGHAGLAARVIVVLDDCRDGTAAICSAFPQVEMMTLARRNVGAARHAGAAAALSDSGRPAELWLASTDADSRVPGHWLASMIDEARRGADLVLGAVLPGPRLSPAAARRWAACHELRDGHPHVHGANLGISGSAYLALGGWRNLASGEDADLARRAAAAGWPAISRTAAAPVMTSARRTGRAPRGFSSYLRALGDPGSAAELPA